VGSAAPRPPLGFLALSLFRFFNEFDASSVSINHKSMTNYIVHENVRQHTRMFTLQKKIQ
jgi:hypothetical protein